MENYNFKKFFRFWGDFYPFSRVEQLLKAHLEWKIDGNIYSENDEGNVIYDYSS